MTDEGQTGCADGSAPSLSGLANGPRIEFLNSTRPSPQCNSAVRRPIALPLLLVTAPLDRVEHRPGARGLALLFLVLVLFRLLGFAAALVLARHHCLHSFMSSVGACGG